MLVAQIFPVSTIFRLNFGTVPTVWYFLFYFIIYVISKRP